MTQHPTSRKDCGPTGSHTAAKFSEVLLPFLLEYSSPYSNVPLYKCVGGLTHVAALSVEKFIENFTLIHQQQSIPSYRHGDS